MLLLLHFHIYTRKGKRKKRGVPGSPVVKALPFQDRGSGFNPWSRTRVPQATGCGQNLEKAKN